VRFQLFRILPPEDEAEIPAGELGRRLGVSESIGLEGPVSLSRDSSETLALLVSRGLLEADRDDHANGRPLVYRPTPGLLQLLGAETLEEARMKMRVPEDYPAQSQLTPEPET
jgi:hypothetical protein